MQDGLPKSNVFCPPLFFFLETGVPVGGVAMLILSPITFHGSLGYCHHHRSSRRTNADNLYCVAKKGKISTRETFRKEHG
jgi:hypothetical protein